MLLLLAFGTSNTFSYRALPEANGEVELAICRCMVERAYVPDWLAFAELKPPPAEFAIRIHHTFPRSEAFHRGSYEQ